jgi:mannose-6-phosphate isomerase-like protein (cupin superfamily)
MQRRGFIKTFASLPCVWSSVARAQTEPDQKAIVVSAGEDRTGQRLMTTPFPLDTKVTTADSAGGLYILEHLNMGKGGPFRHFHHEQDEWFRVLDGEFAFEVGIEKFRLTAGDSIFAPRRVPHVWANVGDRPGSMIALVNPAGSLEAFFKAQARLGRRPTRGEAEELFSAHGMTVVGDPLQVA